jgi:uncharacterized protein YlxW (UPF0749 family)
LSKDKGKAEKQVKGPETYTMLLTDYQVMVAQNKKLPMYEKKLRDEQEDNIFLKDRIKDLEETVKILTPIGSAKEISKDDELNRLRGAYKAYDYEVTTTNGLTIKMQVNPMARDVMIISVSQK